jgi:sugar lactone lactonase YvrE
MLIALPLVLLLVLCAAPLRAATWGELNRAANQAIKANDYARLKGLLTELRAMAPGNPRILYNLAAASARLGEASEAINLLRDLAATGLIYDVKADEDFHSIAGRAEFAGILARFEENKRPVTHAQLERTIAGNDLIPESAVYDRGSKRFLVSSVRKSKIITAEGKLFAKTEWPAFALAIDSKRRLLWASMGWVPQCESCDKSGEGKTALAAFSLESGEIRHRMDSPLKGLLGDMTISRAGGLYISDGIGGALFMLRPGASTLERIDQPGEFPSPQTPALSPDERTLYVADYARGIAAIDLATRAVKWLQPAPGIALSGIDGLYVDRRRFIAVQNGTRPARIVEFSRDLQRQRILEAGWPGLGEPAHGELRGGFFYFLTNTGWDAYNGQGVRKPGPPVSSAIHRLRLR